MSFMLKLHVTSLKWFGDVHQFIVLCARFCLFKLFVVFFFLCAVAMLEIDVKEMYIICSFLTILIYVNTKRNACRFFCIGSKVFHTCLML